MRAFTCGVPYQHCSGGEPMLSAHIRNRGLRVHGSSKEAFRCHVRWLIKERGYTRIGPRTLHREGEPILMLTKQCRFGGELRQGKRADKGKRGGRLMPANRLGGLVGSY